MTRKSTGTACALGLALCAALPVAAQTGGMRCTGVLVVPYDDGTPEDYDMVVERAPTQITVRATSRVTGDRTMDRAPCVWTREWCRFDLGEDGYYEVRLVRNADESFTYTERWNGDSESEESTTMTCEGMQG